MKYLGTIRIFAALAMLGWTSSDARITYFNNNDDFNAYLNVDFGTYVFLNNWGCTYVKAAGSNSFPATGPWTNGVTYDEQPSSGAAVSAVMNYAQKAALGWGMPVLIDVAVLTSSSVPQFGVCYSVKRATFVSDMNLGGHPDKDCKKEGQNFVADPIHAVTGDTYWNEFDYIFPSGRLSQVRYYNSLASAQTNLPVGWSQTYSQRLLVASSGIIAIRPSGQNLIFYIQNGQITPSLSIFEKLQQVPGGWQLRLQNNTIETYDSTGVLLSINYADGSVLNIASASGFQMVTDQFGRALKIVLGSQGLVERVEDSSGNVLAKYGYTTFDTKITLTSAQYADGSSKLYKYDNQKYPLILTGVIDEKSSSIGTGVQFVSWGIDDSGLTISSVNAGGVNGYNLVRSGSDISVMDPLGSTRHMSYSAIGGKSQLDRTDQPAGSGCAAAISSSNYDGNGNVTYEDDFNGNRVCYSYGGSGAGFGNLESSRVEGLSGQANANSAPSNCSAVTNVGAILPSGARKISTEWHPNWGLKTRQAQPLLTTAWVYNGQPDPFNGGQVINCVSAMYGAATLPTLPDGSPITVLCKKVEQATTDVNGSQGFTATPASNANGTTTLRQWTYSYNQYGQLLSMTDPLAHTSNYAYYSDVSFSGTGLSAAGHRTGDLLSVTNAAGHVTQFTAYDQAGHLLSSTEPTGLVNVYSYSPRGWLTAVKQCATAPCDVTANTNGLLTSYDYWPTGLLKQVTLPDGAFLSYTYDDAHRLIGVSDAAGNTVSYTLDNIGNRTGEQLMDSSGVLARNITRTYDALNRLQSVTGAAQ